MKTLWVAAVLIALSNPAVAQDKEMRVTPDALTWKENPAFPKDVQIATLVGDPTKAGDVVVLRIKFPPNFQMPPHTHPYSEVVTLISGPVGTSHGEKFEKNGEMLKPGSMWVYPANMRITLGLEARRRSFRCSLLGQEASTTSTPPTTLARSSPARRHVVGSHKECLACPGTALKTRTCRISRFI